VFWLSLTKSASLESRCDLLLLLLLEMRECDDRLLRLILLFLCLYLFCSSSWHFLHFGSFSLEFSFSFWLSKVFSVSFCCSTNLSLRLSSFYNAYFSMNFWTSTFWTLHTFLRLLYLFWMKSCCWLECFSWFDTSLILDSKYFVLSLTAI